MNSHELCPSCKPIGRCIFEVAAGFVTDEVFFAKTQTPIAPGEKITEEAASAHKEITKLRERAKALGCPNANTINHYYPGKESL